MLQEKSIILPFREFAISSKRLLSPYLGSLVANGPESLEPLASSCVEFLFHYRVLNRQAWRKPEAYTRIAIESAIHKFDTYPDASTNIEIIMQPVIDSIESLLDSLMPHRTMDVFTIERSFGELVLTSHGDYRILKFMEEHPNWQPTSEEPETLVLNTMKHMNFRI